MTVTSQGGTNVKRIKTKAKPEMQSIHFTFSTGLFHLKNVQVSLLNLERRQKEKAKYGMNWVFSKFQRVPLNNWNKMRDCFDSYPSRSESSASL